MPYNVDLLPSASRQLASIDPPDRIRIAAKIDQLAEDPRLFGAIKLEGGENLYRVRVGVYRVIYSIDDGSKSVTVAVIRHRRDVYRER